jgi:hypothetical protein
VASSHFRLSWRHTEWHFHRQWVELWLSKTYVQVLDTGICELTLAWVSADAIKLGNLKELGAWLCGSYPAQVRPSVLSPALQNKLIKVLLLLEPLHQPKRGDHSGFRMCYGLKCLSLQNSHWNWIAKVMVLGHGTFKRRSGHEVSFSQWVQCL